MTQCIRGWWQDVEVPDLEELREELQGAERLGEMWGTRTND